MSDALIGVTKGRDAEFAAALVGSFAVFFVLVYGGASYLSGLVPYRIAVDFAFERELPFIPAAAVVYLSMDVLVGLAPFVLRRFRLLFPLFVVLCVQTLIGAVFFVALPVETAFPAREPTGWSVWFFDAADTMNMERNFLPSLHVAYATTAALAFGNRGGVWAKLCFGLWAFAISVSTIMIHEHHLVDVLAGTLLAWATMRWLYPWVRDSRFAIHVEVELRLLREFFVFGLRHPRYWLIALALYKASAGRLLARRILRSGFVFLQVVDDLLDGDRADPRDPLAISATLTDELQSGRFGAGPYSYLARTFAADLDRIDAREEGMPKAIELIRTMERDRKRAESGRALDEGALKKQLHDTFSLSIDLMLLAGESTVRSSDVPSLVEAFGWCSVVRDLREDLDKGLCNIPSEVVETLPQERLPDYATAARSPSVSRWLEQERQRAERCINQADVELDELDDTSGVATLRMFNRSIRRYLNRPPLRPSRTEPALS